MTKQQFLTALEKALHKLPKEEKEEMLQDFEEHFAIGEAEGKSEQEIIAALGSPQQIAKETITANSYDQTSTNMTIGNMMRAIWAGIGVGFFNLVIVLGPFIAVLGLILSGWILGISLISAPLLFVVNIIVYPSSFELFELFLTIGLCGFGIFTIMGMYEVTKWSAYGCMKYVQFNISLVKGGLQT